MDSKEWGDLLHFVLPGIPDIENKEVAYALTKYRAQCQIDLGDWLAAREFEERLRRKKC